VEEISKETIRIMLTKLFGFLISLDALISMFWFRGNRRRTYNLEQLGRVVRLIIGLVLILL